MGFFDDLFGSLFGRKQKIPDLPAVPARGTTEVKEARRKARRRTTSISRRTILGGTTGGGETVARKTLLGE